MNVKDRFLRYVSCPTASAEDTGKTPSTDGQLTLAKMLVGELLEIGVTDARMDGYGYVYASIPANTDKAANKIGFIAHMDTSAEAPAENIKPRELVYEGGDIVLSPGVTLSPNEYPCLNSYVGDRLIVTDGTTLLGADDKAGIAEIIAAAERIIRSGKPHGHISIAFTPDEEIGEGADHFSLSEFGADYAYTVDGGGLGEVEYENFNAASAVVTVNGVSIHPGSAKGKMKNAARIACEFNSRLPEREIPELTEGYEGFHHMLSISGGCERAQMVYIIRDHDMDLFEKRKAGFISLADEMNKTLGDGTVEVSFKDSYYNMAEIVKKNAFIVDRAAAAMRSVGVEPTTVPIRGGTDGARLSFMGLPCPNLSVGGENFHSRLEFVSVDSMERMVDVIVAIAEGALSDGYMGIIK